MNDDETDQMIEDSKQELQQQKSDIARNGENIAKKTIQQATKKGVKEKVVSKAVTMLGPLIPYIVGAIVVIFIIIAIVGIIGFLITMPGLMKGKLTSFFIGISDWWKQLYTSEAVVSVKDEDIVEIGNYIADMGYDLIGFGFITPKDEYYIATSEILEKEGYIEERNDEAGTIKYVKNDENNDKTYYEDNFIYKDGITYDGKTGKKIQYASDDEENNSGYTKYGIQYDSSGKISSFENVDSSLIRKYAISNNRIFVIRNYDEDSNVVKKLHDFFNGTKKENAWSKGLISLYNAENFKATEFYKKSIFDAKINVNQGSDGSKTLKIDSMFDNEMNFNLDGWTGRYGLSQDFLIALHLATLSPELVDQMVENFDTTAQVYLDKVSNKDKENEEDFSWAEAKVVDTVSNVYGGEDITSNDVGLTVKDLSSVGIDANDKGLDTAAWWINNNEAVDFFYNTEMAGHKYCTNGYKAGIPNHVLPSGDVNDFSGGFDDGLNVINNLNGEDGYIAQNVPNYILDYDNSLDGLDTVSYNMAEVVKQFVDKLDGRYNFNKDDFYSKVHLEDDDKCSIKALANNAENPYDIIKFSGRWTNNAGSVDSGYYGLCIQAQDGIMEELDKTGNYSLKNYFSPTFFEDSGREELEGYGDPDVESGNPTVYYWNDKDDYLKLENVGTTCVYEYNDNLNHETDHLNTFDCECDFCTTFWNKWTRGFQVEWEKEGGDSCFDPSIVNIAEIPGDDVNNMSAIDLYSWFNDYTDPNTGKTETLQYNITFYFPKMEPKEGIICITRSWTAKEAQTICLRKEEIKTCYEQVLNYKNVEGDTIDEVEKEVVVCSQCKSYIHDLVKSLLAINDNKFETEVPYIARVINSWFRDTYFVIPESPDEAIEKAQEDFPYYKDHPLYGNNVSVIENNDVILENTGELWTKYVMYKNNYALFFINNNGDLFKSEDEVTAFLDNLQSEKGLTDEERKYIDKFLEKKYEYSESDTSSAIVTYALWKAETDEDLQYSDEKKANEIIEKYGISLVKIPINKTVDKLNQDGEKVKDIAWNAYGLNNDESSIVWQTMDASNAYVPMVLDNYGGIEKGGSIQFYVGLHNVFNLIQVRDAQRGMTNSKIKYMFKNRKYYKYDGSIQRAYDIHNDWIECLEFFEFDEDLLNDIINNYYLNEPVETSYQFARDFDEDGIADIASPNIKEDEYNELKITEDTVKTYDPRNPNLIDKIDLNLESLNAFSILENTPSEDAEYAYRDLKELLVELDYFDTEDLIEPAKDILEWVLPDSGSCGWPYRIYDKTSQFGTLIHSKDMYDNLNEINLESVQESELSSPVQTQGSDTSEDSEDGAIENDDDQLLSLSSAISSRATTSTLSTDIQETSDKGTGYDATVIVNNVTYKAFKQSHADFANDTFYMKGQSSSFSSSACGPTSVAIVLSGYGVDVTTRDTAKKLNEVVGNGYSGSREQLQTLLKEYNLDSTVYNSNASGVENLRTALSEGKPVIINVGWRNGNSNYDEWTASGGHYMVLVGEDGNNVYIIDPAFTEKHMPNDKKNNNRSEYVEYGYGYSIHKKGLEDLVNNYLTGYIIPESAPNDVILDDNPILQESTVKKFTGFEKGEPIVSPATAKILEIGTVTVNNETQESVLDTYYVSSDGKSSNSNSDDEEDGLDSNSNQEDDDDSASNSNQDDDDDSSSNSLQTDEDGGSESKKIVVTKNQYENISKKAEEMQNDESNPFGKSYTTGYVKLEVIGKESIERFKSLGKSNIVEGLNAFYDDYYNDANHKSVCDSFTIYIEGIDLTGDLEDNNVLEEDLSNTILAKLFNENTDGEEFSSSLYTQSNDVGDSDAENSDENDSDTENSDENDSNAENSDESDSDAVNLNELNLNYYTKREAPAYYTLGAKNKLEQKENKKAKLPSVIKLDVEDAENNNGEIYVKAGTILGVTENANIKIIMKDKDNSVVENVEEYLEIEDEVETSKTVNVKTNSEKFSVIDTALSESEWVSLAKAYTSNKPGDGVFNNEANLKDFYRICRENGVNPEVAFTRAIDESGFDSKGTNNYWGADTPNNSKNLASFSTWQDGLKRFCELYTRYQDPTTSDYQAIMNTYEERKACTDFGGSDPNGYGTPDTLQGIQSLYSYLGDDHNANDSSNGGMYYLYPWSWDKSNQYTGENKIIFEDKAEFEEKCGSIHGTSGGKTSSTPTSVYEQAGYTAWQVRKMVKEARDIFGDKAGCYAGTSN